MQKVVVRKIRVNSECNGHTYNSGCDKIVASSECSEFEEVIQKEIDDGWKVTNVSSSYDQGWHCHLVVFVLEKNEYKEEIS